MWVVVAAPKRPLRSSRRDAHGSSFIGIAIFKCCIPIAHHEEWTTRAPGWGRIRLHPVCPLEYIWRVFTDICCWIASKNGVVPFGRSSLACAKFRFSASDPYLAVNTWVEDAGLTWCWFDVFQLCRDTTNGGLCCWHERRRAIEQLECFVFGVYHVAAL